MKGLLPHLLIASCLVTVMSSPQAALSETLYSRWQMQRLLHPNQKQLQQEQRGKVFIYEGLKDKQVDNIMQTQFERLQAMMFVGTIVTDDTGAPKRDPANGDVQYEDDGC
jgi:hypothetical protein